MKISILGKGLAGCFTALHYKHYAPHIEVELIHDSNKPSLVVGQGTFEDAAKLLWDALQVDWHKNPIKATPKTGILYKGWGKKKKEFFHPFPLHHVALHYDTHQLQDFIINNIPISIESRHINSYSEVDADYIFDCRGFPSDYEDYEELKNPVNASLLSNIDEVYHDVRWTTSQATPDGWCFIIPTTEGTSLGYLFNSNITEEKLAEDNFRKLFGISKINGRLAFRNYMAKEPIIDNRIILNGNRLFFLEPLEATAVSTYLNWIRLTFSYIVLKENTSKEVSRSIRQKIKQVQNFILYHYLHGSEYDTKFWKESKKYKITDNKFHDIMEFSTSTKEPINIDYGLNDRINNYGVHQSFSFKNMHDGLV